jgi:hypothetical protein
MEFTEKDVCLYILAPNTVSCMQWYGPRRVTDSCYPKCSNDAHLARKVCALVVLLLQVVLGSNWYVHWFRFILFYSVVLLWTTGVVL